MSKKCCGDPSCANKEACGVEEVSNPEVKEEVKVKEPEVLNVTEDDVKIVYTNSLGRIHNPNGPAVLWKKENKQEYFLHGLRTRKEGPALISDEKEEYWYLGKLGNFDPNGWTVKYSNGTLEYIKAGKFHRENGPAVEYHDGGWEYYSKGVKTRADGPAVRYSDGTVEYWYENVHLTNCHNDDDLKKYIMLSNLNF
jgi:hypothetical protein